MTLICECGHGRPQLPGGGCDACRAQELERIDPRVWVARSADPFGDAEVYVFASEELAQRFAGTRGDDYLVTKEPVLDSAFVAEAELELEEA